MSRSFQSHFSCHRSLCAKLDAAQSKNIYRAKKHFLYDRKNREYMDCINAVSHVGHSHPMVINEIINQMNLGNSLPEGFTFAEKKPYEQSLLNRLPHHIDSLVFCASGTEAVDLAIQMAQAYTHQKHVVCLAHSFHGCTESVYNFSSKLHAESHVSPDWVSIVSVPRENAKIRKADLRYPVFQDVQTIFTKLKAQNEKVACFLSEPIQGLNGDIPSKSWLQQTYKLTREMGGLCIADEVQTGLGRLGTHFWAYEAQKVNPDIVVIGKAMGNGYPMAAVATSKDIVSAIGKDIEKYKGTPVAMAAGHAVLTAIDHDKLMESAVVVGKTLKRLLEQLKMKHLVIGNVWGRGLLFAVEIIDRNFIYDSSKNLTKLIVSRLNDERISIAVEGYWQNLIIIMPPMSFGESDAMKLVSTFDLVLSSISEPRVIEDQQISDKAGGCFVNRVGIFQQAPWVPKTEETSEYNLNLNDSYASID